MASSSRASPTLGKRHSVTATLSTEGWGPWMRYMKMEQGKSEALMQTPDGTPLLLLNRVGQGRVASRDVRPALALGARL